MDSVGTDVFLKGVKDKAIAFQAAQQKPKNVRKALEKVKETTAVANLLGNSAASSRFVTFEDEFLVRHSTIAAPEHQNYRPHSFQNSPQRSQHYSDHPRRDPSPSKPTYGYANDRRGRSASPVWQNNTSDYCDRHSS